MAKTAVAMVAVLQRQSVGLKRAMAKRKEIPDHIRNQVLVAAMHRCCLCPEHNDVVDLHHVILISKRGRDTEENLMAVCPTCHAKIHRIRNRYNVKQLRMYKESWVRLCALGLPLDVRMAQAFDTEKPPVAAKMPPGMEAPPAPHLAHPYPLQENFTGRVRERRMLTEWLTADTQPMLVIEAIGGMGKSAVTWAWLWRDVLGRPLPEMRADRCDLAPGCRVAEADRPEGVLWWSFYERESSFDGFVAEALTYFSGGTIDPRSMDSLHDRMTALEHVLCGRRFLIVLDGVERILRAYARLDAAYRGDEVEGDPRGDFRSCSDPRAGRFLQGLASVAMKSKVLLTSRLFPRELDQMGGCRHEELRAFNPEDAVEFFLAQGVKGTRAEIEAACEPYGYHPLCMRLLSGMIVEDPERPGDIAVAAGYDPVPNLVPHESGRTHHVLELAYNAIRPALRELLSRLAAFRSPMEYDAVKVISPVESKEELKAALRELIARGLLLRDEKQVRFDFHPVVRQYAYKHLADNRVVHGQLAKHFASFAKKTKKQPMIRSADDLEPLIELYHHLVLSGQYSKALHLYRHRLHRSLFMEFGHFQTCVEMLSNLLFDSKERLRRLKDRVAEGHLLNALAASYRYLGQPRQAVRLYMSFAAIPNDPAGVAVRMGNLARSLIALGDLTQAEEILEQGIRACCSISGILGRFWECAHRSRMATLLATEGDFHGGAQHLREAHQAAGSVVEANHYYLAGRGHYYLLMNKPTTALKAARLAWNSKDKMGNQDAESYYPRERDFIRSGWLLGSALVRCGARKRRSNTAEMTEAAQHLSEALSHCRRINMVDFEPHILLTQAKWHHLKGDAAQARASTQEALAIADRCEYRLKQADIHNFLAQLALDRGDEKAAAEEARIAYERAWCDGPPHCYKPALDEAAGLLTRLGDAPPSMP